MTHQGRFVSPFPIVVDHAEGPFKYDVDGNRLIDYMMGHGSLLMGHAHGISSIVQVNLGADCDCDRGLCTLPYETIHETMTVEKMNAVRRAMFINGIDMNAGRKFVVSSVHDEDVIDETIEAFDRSLRALREEGVV